MIGDPVRWPAELLAAEASAELQMLTVLRAEERCLRYRRETCLPAGFGSVSLQALTAANGS